MLADAGLLAGGNVRVLQHDHELGEGFLAVVLGVLLRGTALAVLLRRGVAGCRDLKRWHEGDRRLFAAGAVLGLHGGLPAQAGWGDQHVSSLECSKLHDETGKSCASACRRIKQADRAAPSAGRWEQACL